MSTSAVVDDTRETRIGNSADDPIGTFYTSHPYPPPVASLDRSRREWQTPNRRQAEFRLLWPAGAYRDDLDILVAGCGTSQAAKHAIAWPRARVSAIDISATSLEHTRSLTRKYNLTNLVAEPLAIEAVRTLDRTFDLIVCTGVLHHLVDPDAGLRALRSVLKPGGVMHVMVYASYGRAGVYMLQEYCRRLGIGTSPGDIEELARALTSLPRHHPLSTLVAQSKDFAQADALADTLLNPRDRAYSVPQLFELIAGAGLEFVRWHRQAPYLPQCGALSTSPHNARLTALSAPEQYAAVELWRGSIARHSAVVRVTRSSTAAPSVQFNDDRWRRFVPIRLPHTLCIQERLPPGAAAVLLNQSHTHTDLVLPIDVLERHLFDAIDGSRSIAAIVECVPEGKNGDKSWDRARMFFERLWAWDQVVFDVSQGESIG